MYSTSTYHTTSEQLSLSLMPIFCNNICSIKPKNVASKKLIIFFVKNNSAYFLICYGYFVFYSIRTIVDKWIAKNVRFDGSSFSQSTV